MSISKPWLFVDTEGATDPQGTFTDPGRQWTFLICAANDDHQQVKYAPRPLTTKEMLWFITQLPNTYKLGGFFFRYDIDQILHHLPEEQLKRIYEGQPAIYQKWIIQLFNTQLTIIRPMNMPTEPPDDITKLRGIRRVIWDVGKFYQCRLSQAIDDWQVAKPEEQTFIEKMKEERSDFNLQYWQENHKTIIDYSILENKLASRLQTKFDATCEELGYPLKNWYGAGSMAKSMMAQHKIKEHLQNQKVPRLYKNPENEMMRQLPFTYFGGRFEIIRPGRFKPVHEYDLCSAYPAAYRFLPCLQHGEWKLKKDYDEYLKGGQHDLHMVEWDISRTHNWGPFPRRDKQGRISYPKNGHTHYVWGEELLAATKIWRLHKDIRIIKTWKYHKKCGCKPFEWIDEVYKQRLSLGKNTKGYPLKLGMNAIYGSLASVLGATQEKMRWCQPQWASMISAWTRARLLESIHTAGGPKTNKIIMFATDAVYTIEEIPLDLTGGLGGWEHKFFPEGGLLIQPGVYHLQGQGAVSKLKGRGISFKDIQDQIRHFYAAYDSKGDQASYEITLQPRYQSVRLMLHRNNLKNAWRWKQEKKKISFDPSAKRDLIRGKWKPPMDTINSGHPHPGLYELLCGKTIDIQPISSEQLEDQLISEAQPNGPYAA